MEFQGGGMVFARQGRFDKKESRVTVHYEMKTSKDILTRVTLILTLPSPTIGWMDGCANLVCPLKIQLIKRKQSQRVYILTHLLIVLCQ